MTPSRLFTDTRSNPTLDLLTDAIIRREGEGAVCSTYLSESSSTPTETPTLSEELPPSTRIAPFRAAAPVLIVRAAPPTLPTRRALEGNGPGGLPLEAAGNSPNANAEESAALQAAAPLWPLVASFAIGASAAAFAGAASDRWCLELAIVACMVAGTLTLWAAVWPPR
jgi:hypothetical protein